jgi:hypothetical protein
VRRTAIAAIAAVIAVASLPATAETVKFIGCPVRVAEGCLIVRNGPIVYNISSAQPSPRVGYRAIAVIADIYRRHRPLLRQAARPHPVALHPAVELPAGLRLSQLRVGVAASYSSRM